MNEIASITLDQWDEHYRKLVAAGLREPSYGGPLRRHVEDGDLRLLRLRFDPSPAALRLWNFLLTEEDRLRIAREEGKLLVGVMKDLGTTALLAYCLPQLVAFYPDGAWWIPCVMEMQEGLFQIADSLGINDSFCPVRAMLGAFETGNHFPIPDMLFCSAGATCDDFSAIAQRLEGLGHPIFWWEMPHRRKPEPGEPQVVLPGGFIAPAEQVAVVRDELERVRLALQDLAGSLLDDARIAAGIRKANRVRSLLAELRRLTFTADRCPMPALEMLVAEMLAIHFCSDFDETILVLDDLLKEVSARARSGQGVLPPEAVRVYWVNPVADLQAMNLLESCGGRVCGTEYLFSHALDLIPEDLPPMEALARMALADPMVGPSADRAERICRDAAAFGAEAVLISRIPGASHCAFEGEIIADEVRNRLGLPAAEIEVPSLCDASGPRLATRLGGLIETALRRRGS